jgi:hypothetical protein
MQAFQPLSRLGMVLAFQVIVIRACLLNMKRPLFRHGGAGNRAMATSDYLTLRQAQGLIAAAQYALHIGKPLTRHLTVRLDL